MPETLPEPAGTLPRFSDLGLSPPLLETLAELGYESPSPIQAATIPPLLAGRDLLGQAQTGTGKTAAFALPVLTRLDLALQRPQALVLTPTRELAIQVAEAFQRYASRLRGFHVLPVYGGQGYGPQLSALRRGVHVIVGTPGRVIDHLERGSLDLSALQTLVLDEADEMLRMGFIDDVEAVLKKTPEQRQVALLSATMPAPIRRIAKTYLREPAEVSITAKTTTAASIRQRYWWVSGVHKLDALTRILEAEPFDAMLVFVRTKVASEELAQKLMARGLAAVAINGDLQQAQRERIIQQLKDGRLDILVATDVAARGLDVERISHVLNYDIPHDTESYVHRIGRTGRAGRKGEAILFVAPREQHMLRAIERATRQPIEQMTLPSVEAVNDQRVARFMERMLGALGATDLDTYRDLVQRFEQEHNVPMAEIAAALARLVQGETPLLLPPEPERKPRAVRPARQRPAGDQARDPGEQPGTLPAGERPSRPRPGPDRPRRDATGPDGEPVRMETFRVAVGHQHGVKPGNLVGAIANEADIDSRYIGRIDIREDYSLVDLPEGMPGETLAHLQKVFVAGQRLAMRREGAAPAAGKPRRPAAGPRRSPPRGRPARKPGGKPGADRRR